MEKSEKVIHQSSGAVTFGIKYQDPKPDDIPDMAYKADRFNNILSGAEKITYKTYL